VLTGVIVKCTAHQLLGACLLAQVQHHVAAAAQPGSSGRIRRLGQLTPRSALLFWQDGALIWLHTCTGQAGGSAEHRTGRSCINCDSNASRRDQGLLLGLLFQAGKEASAWGAAPLRISSGISFCLCFALTPYTCTNLCQHHHGMPSASLKSVCRGFWQDAAHTHFVLSFTAVPAGGPVWETA
jgi:hypothetical protein